MAILGLGEKLQYAKCIKNVKAAVQEFLNSAPHISEAFGDNFMPLFEFEFSCFLARVTDVVVFKNEDLHKVLIPALLKECADCPYISSYAFNGLDAIDIVGDRVQHYDSILCGEWEPPMYWNLSNASIPQDTLTKQLSLLGDYLYYSTKLREIPVGDDIESAPLGNDLINNYIVIPTSMSYILFEIILPHVVEYGNYFLHQLNKDSTPTAKGASVQGSPVPQKKRSNRTTIAACICTAILAISCAVLGATSYQAHRRISELEKDLNDAHKQIASLEESVEVRQRALINALNDEIDNLQNRLRNVERRVIPKEETWESILEQYGVSTP